MQEGFRLFFFFALKAIFQLLKFEFCQIKLEVKSRIALQITGKTLLKLDSNSSLLLEYGRKFAYCLKSVFVQTMQSSFKSNFLYRHMDNCTVHEKLTTKKSSSRAPGK